MARPKDSRFEVELDALKSPRRRPRKSWFDKDSRPADNLMSSVNVMNAEKMPAEYDVMIVDHFSRPPKVDFGDTLQGRCKRRFLKVINEKSHDVLLTVDKVPTHFVLSTDDRELLVPARSHIMLAIDWEPKDEGGQHGVVKFMADNGIKTFRLHLALFGKCQRDPKAKKKVKKNMASSSSTTFAIPRSRAAAIEDKENIAPAASITQIIAGPTEPQGRAAVINKPLHKSQLDVDGDTTIKAALNVTEFNFSLLQEMKPQITSTVCKAGHSQDPVQSPPSARRGLQLTDVNQSPELDVKERHVSPESMLVAPVGTPVFFTPGYRKKSRKHRRRSNTYNTDSPITPRELIPDISATTRTLSDSPYIRPLSATPKGLLTPLRAALSRVHRRKVVEEGSQSTLEEGMLCEADLKQEAEDEIGPLTPVAELAAHQGATLTCEEKRRSTFSLDSATLSNTPTIGDETCILAHPVFASPAATDVMPLPAATDVMPSPAVTDVMPSPAATDAESSDKSFSPDSLEDEKPKTESPGPLAQSSFCQPNTGPIPEPPVVPLFGQTVTLGTWQRKTEVEETVLSVEDLLETSSVAAGTKRKSCEGTRPLEKYSKIVSDRAGRLAVTRRPTHVKTLLLKKPKLQGSIRQTLPYVTKNRFYDDRWREKQEKSFTRWMNYLLIPTMLDSEQTIPQQPSPDSAQAAADMTSLLTSTAKMMKAPSKELMSLRNYTAIRKLNTLRRRALQLFQHDDMSDVFLSIEEAVDEGKLCISRGKSIHADIGLRISLISVLLCYTPLWLRVGLETVLGEAIEMRSTSDTSTLKTLIMLRILGDPHITAEYSHPYVANLFKDGYQHEIGKHILRKLLMLVYFLDKAKTERLIEYDPCLFLVKSEYKSSKDILLFMAREIMTGEGDIMRHLGHLGYKVSYQQRALDEFKYAVNSLSADLRDGVRLTRVMETLTKDYSLSKSLRVPATSLTNKRYNVQVALKCLSKCGVEYQPIKAEDIVSGHREKTLQLLWIIISNFQLTQLVDMASLRDEISQLTKSLRVCGLSDPLAAPLLDDDSAKGLLLRWAVLVCAHHDVSVFNFSASFTDGRALCYLIKHYQPSLVVNVHDSTTLTRLSHESEEADDSSYTILDDSVNLEDLLKNDKENFKTLHRAVLELGGIPVISGSADMVSTVPDERTTCLYVTYICARLLEIREETWAARVVQRLWRSMKSREMAIKEEKARQEAVSTIQRWYRLRKDTLSTRRQFIQLKQVTIKLQQLFRSKLLTNRLRSDFCATRGAVVVIQRAWRRRLAALKAEQRLLDEERMGSAAVIVQRRWRLILQGKVFRQRFLSLKRATLFIQRRFVAKKAGHAARTAFLSLKDSVVRIQGLWRSVALRRYFKTSRQAAVVVQRWYRRCRAARVERCAYLRLREAAIYIQQRYRGHLAVVAAMGVKESKIRAVVTLQRWYRSTLVRRRFAQLQRAVITLQRRHRSSRETRRCAIGYKCMRQATLLIQRRWRAVINMRRERSLYTIRRSSALVLQRWFRLTMAAKRCRQRFIAQRRAAVGIQRWYRLIIAIRIQRDLLLRHRICAATLLQRHWRAVKLGRKIRTRYLSMKTAACRIQQWLRGHKVTQLHREQFLELRQSTVLIQNWWRAERSMRKQQQQFLALKSSALYLQRRLRAIAKMKTCRREFLCQKRASIVIQRSWCATVLSRAQRSSYLVLRLSVLCIQRHWRALKAGKLCSERLKRERSACSKIQAWYRSTKLTSTFRNNFIALRCNAVTIQRRWRAVMEMRRCVRSYRTTLSAARAIEEWYRRCLLGRQQRKLYRKTLRAVRCIQDQWRARASMTKCRDGYRRQKMAAITVQRWFRGLKSTRVLKKAFIQTRNAAITVQRAYRAHLLRVYQRKCLRVYAAVCIQRRYRAVMVARRQRLQFVHLRAAAVCIQHRIRALMVGRQVRGEYTQLRECVVAMQRRCRANSLMKECRQQYQRMRRSVIVIQKWMETVWEMRRQRCKFLSLKRASVTLQRSYRAWRCRKAFVRTMDATLCIQKHYRAFVAGKIQLCRFLQMKSSAVSIQRWYRGCVLETALRQDHQRKLTAISIIQKHLRALLLSRKERTAYLQLRTTAVIVQERWRSKRLVRQCRERYIQLQSAAGIIQKWYRLCKLTKSVRQRFLLLQSAVCVVQRCWRLKALARHCRTHYLRLRHSIVLIQKAFRGYLLVKIHRSMFLGRKRAVLTIQTWYRSCRLTQQRRTGFLAMKQSAVLMQSRCRAAFVRRRFHLQRQAASHIQQHWRSWRFTQMERQRYLAMKSAATVIQRSWRSRIRRISNETMNVAARRIQTCWRTYRCTRRERRSYLHLRSRVVRIQSWWRACAVRREYLVQRGAASTIQTWWRQLLLLRTERRAKRNLQFVIKIQSWYRMAYVRRQYLHSLRDMKLQVSAAVILQTYVRRWLAIKEATVKRGAIITIQAAWRGNCVRRSVKKVQTTAIRQRLRSANRRASTQQTLGQRTATAISYVVLYGTIRKILKALQHLVVTTKWSSACRLEVARSQALVELVSLMNSCNRSEPHKEILQLSLEVIDNLAKDPVTAPVVAGTKYAINTVLELLTIYVDTGPLVFQTGCRALSSFTTHDPIRQKLFADKFVMTQLAAVLKVAAHKFSIAQRVKSKKVRAAFVSHEAVSQLLKQISATDVGQ